MTVEKSELVDEVIENLKNDILNGDLTVLEELLYKLPNKVLIESLSEETWEKYKDINKL